jgi:hypothetical protein
MMKIDAKVVKNRYNNIFQRNLKASCKKITKNNHFVGARLGNSFRTSGSPFPFSIKAKVSYSAIRPSETLLLPKPLVVDNLSALGAMPLQQEVQKQEKINANMNTKI